MFIEPDGTRVAPEIPGAILDEQYDGDEINRQDDQVGQPELVKEAQDYRESQERQHKEIRDATAFHEQEKQPDQDGGGRKTQQRHPSLEQGRHRKAGVGTGSNDRSENQARRGR